MMRKLNERLDELSREPSQYKDYRDYHEHGFNDHLKQYFDVVERDRGSGIVQLNPSGDFKPCFQDAVWFFVSNYYNVLKARIIGRKFGYELMQCYLQECGIPEYCCSKGPVYYPLEELGVLAKIDGMEFCGRFMTCLKENTEYHWEQVSSWLRGRKKTRGLKTLCDLFYACVIRVDHPEISVGLGKNGAEILDLFISV